MKSTLIKYLLEPRSLFSSTEATNLKALKKRVTPGDVLLLSGNTKKDTVVKTLTGSIWSRALLYVGDSSTPLTEAQKSQFTDKYGKAALQHLVIESDPIIGNKIIPLDAFVGQLVRHCLPSAIKRDDRSKVVKYALEQVKTNQNYDPELKTVFFFVLPWGILPYRLRDILAEYSLAEGEGVCSGTVAKAFRSVGYPIRPVDVIQNRSGKHKLATQTLRSLKNRGKSAIKLVLSGKVDKAASRILSRSYAKIAYSQVRSITPGDYDLSRFFEVKKDPDDLAINY